MGSEDGAVLVAELRGDGLAIAFDLRRHFIECLVEAGQFGGHRRTLEDPP